jgi:hypothetical protein
MFGCVWWSLEICWLGELPCSLHRFPEAGGRHAGILFLIYNQEYFIHFFSGWASMDDEEAALLAAAIELSLRDTGGPAEQPVAAPSRNSPH